MKVGLVLGAGGVKGVAWLTGALDALAETTGWDPATADYIVGTSAGSIIGALTAAGVPPWFMVAHSSGRSPARETAAQFKPTPGFPRLGPASVKLALATLRDPLNYTPATALVGWLPEGIISTDPVKEIIRRAVPSGWSAHPNLWVVAADLETGKRVVFGRDGSPPAELADAVAASCAIPSFYKPVTIGGRRYIDGGVSSPSNLDLMKGLGLDLVICLNPMSSLSRAENWQLYRRFGDAIRAVSGRRVGNERRKVEESGTPVVLIQPTAEDIDVMGTNLMSSSKRNQVMTVARRTVAEQLKSPALEAALGNLPHKARRAKGAVAG